MNNRAVSAELFRMLPLLEKVECGWDPGEGLLLELGFLLAQLRAMSSEELCRPVLNKARLSPPFRSEPLLLVRRARIVPLLQR